MYDVVIIGGGPAGLFSVFCCGLEGLSCAVFDSNAELGGQCRSLYSNKNIYDIPGHKEITGGALIDNLLSQISVFDYDVFLNSFVSSVTKEDNVFIIKSNDLLVKARSLIIALGAGVYQPARLSVPFDRELEGDKIFYAVDDVQKFCEKEVAILGGGDSALDWALELSEVASKVYLIHRRDCFRANALNVARVDSCASIEKMAPYFLKEIRTSGHRLILKGCSDVAVDYVLPFYGAVSNLNFLKTWDLALRQSKILVDFSTMQTSRRGIFAIGDCITYDGKRNLILTGFSEAMVASRAIFKFLYPNKAFNSTYSTNLGVFTTSK